MTFVALTSAAVAGVPHEDAGIASALLNAGQQVGGALGLAILTAVSTARTNALVPGRPSTDPGLRLRRALVDGWSLGFVVGGGPAGPRRRRHGLAGEVSKDRRSRPSRTRPSRPDRTAARRVAVLSPRRA